MNLLWDGPGRLVNLAPRWLLGAAGAVVLALGILLVPRPLSSAAVLCLWAAVSLALTGVLDLLGRRRDAGSADRRAARASRPAWIGPAVSVASVLLGVAVVVLLRQTMAILPIVLVAALICWGLVRARAALHRSSSPTARVLAGSLGVSAIALGVVAAWWPDLALVLAGAAFAVRTVVGGITLVARAIAPGQRPRFPRRPAALRPVLRVIAAVLVVALAAGGLLGSLRLRSGTPELTDFYRTPASLPADPGVLIRSQRYTTDVPDGVTAWRILHTTTNADGSPAVASGIVAIPSAPGSGPHPVVAIAHGTIGIARNCAISLGGSALTEAAIPAMKQVFANGWTVVATDYTGQGAEGRYPYLVGQSEARSTLDAVRAARELTPLTRRTVVWGHSQGGHAALWTAKIAARYAPDVPITATAAFSPASDPYDLARKVLASGSSLSNIVTAYVAASYTRIYPDISLEQYQNPAASVLVDQAARRCASSPDILVSVLSLSAVSHDRPVFSADLGEGALADRLRQNLASGPFQGKVFIAQGTADEVIPISLQRRFVADRCAAGQPIYFREYPGRTHMGILAAGSPFPADLVGWTRQAFAGTAKASNCR